MTIAPQRNPGPIRRLQAPNSLGVGNLAAGGHLSQLRYQAVVWESDGKAYSRATYKTERAAKEAVGSGHGHVYDLSLRMRIA